MPEDDAADPEASIITKVVAPLLVKLIPPLVAAIMGAVGGMSVHKVEDADHNARVENNRERLLAYKAESEAAKAQLVSYTSTIVHNEEQNREQDIRILERRIDQLVWAMRAKGMRVQDPMPAPQ